MSGALFKELDLDRHARLLRRATGSPQPVAVCNREGEVVWTMEGPSGAAIARIIADLNEEQGEIFQSGGGAQRLEVGAGRELVYGPIHAGSKEEVGWLAVLVDRSSPPGDVEIFDETLLDAAASIGSEYRLNDEIQSLVGELSGRYEELNLFYTLEGQTRALDGGTFGAQALLQNFAALLDVDLAAFVLADRPSPIYAASTRRPIANLDLVLTQLRRDLFRFVAASKHPLILNETDDVRREYLFINMPYRVLACPVAAGGAVEAMLVLLRHTDRPDFTASDRNLGKVIAGQTAIIMRNQAMVGELRKFSEQMAGALIEAVEAKDPYTRGHSERVQSISTRIGRCAGLDAAAVEDISWGALLHDVGKIGIPDRILCKTGRLTEDEYTLVKIHPERSYEILRHIDNLGSNALKAARYHQERFDGAGYPHGLKGLQIPVHARVIAVGDTYDAITSSRAYRAAQSHQFAMAEIARGAGTQLDPEFVSLFEKMCEEDLGWLKAITDLRKPRDE